MNRRQAWSLAVCLVIFAALLVWCACTEAAAKELAEALRAAKEEEAAAAGQLHDLRRENEALQEAVDKLSSEAEEQREEADLAKRLAKLPRIDGCTVSHYCCEKREHICGGGDGITASGEPVQAEVSVAVDPLVIPLGSTVYVDYGDGESHTYTAHDTGGAVNGAHIDVAVETHEEALRRGMKTATVWWEEQR